jgi:hypothetical protein
MDDTTKTVTGATQTCWLETAESAIASFLGEGAALADDVLPGDAAIVNALAGAVEAALAALKAFHTGVVVPKLPAA